MTNITLNSVHTNISPQLAMSHIEEEKTFSAIYVIVIPTIYKKVKKRINKKKIYRFKVIKTNSKTGADFSHKQQHIS